ncbi:acetyl-CoA carboxylase carboxyltransferase subunit alpha [Deinococcus peraridilitoris]|uniref:Acetyl-coenzyme A carboxylase carboxyl transferase subunit alpha n=1 Tax=Deinococcus peraridilitoris (strain DSM 19664 / LMG 22246 / CIP 109416 / KR-200) TaxID=937777 RepID=K9ZX35_DEIPD|nr:acetyl-CoA carboxylase carboxyltransferase subunit alpha [Deinococcus peraridilitoris]AFZ66208.1 acetyl-CoA carboxylase, carboxyl transferase, alpha subunit [Deinococcus peraridilitoris DSM 19664]
MSEASLQGLERQIVDLERLARETGENFEAELQPLRDKLGRLRSERSQNLSRWERVQLARAPGRPTALEYVHRLFTGFVELHGDRAFGDDPALIGGPAQFGDQSVMLLMQHKGRDTKGKIRRRFGMSNPEGYRKAIRLMDLADKFGLPVIALIDTPGAYPGIEAEERGQGWAIAESIQRMARLRVPVVCAVIGEGGSGGALAIGVGNRVLIQENAWYSVISPEACASIVWRDAAKAPEAAEALQLTAPDLKRLGIVEDVIAEPVGGAHLDAVEAARLLGEALELHLRELQQLSSEQLLAQRSQRFRRLGVFAEV